MGKIRLTGRHTFRIINGERQGVILLENEKFAKFNPSLLGLGDVGLPAKQVEALAAVFDLSGFTIFCSQVDQHLVVPEYLSRFVDWLFDEIKKGLKIRGYRKHKALCAQLPFMAKFLGDGVLFLWDTRDMSDTLICNIVTLLCEICQAYKQEFYPKIRREVANPPNVLRCGIARGRVCSVGKDRDYVGPCINLASRLQKLSFLTFSFPRRGFDVEAHMHPSMIDELIEKRITVRGRGIAVGELVWVLKQEFDELPEEEKAFFGEP